MELRFDYVIKLEIFQASTYLDFRYKNLQFLPNVTTGNTQTKLRNNLLPSQLANLTFLKLNR
jgi:hypothetical protein